MSATTAGAIKAWLERPGRLVTGVSWYRDRAPKDAALPYGVIQEGISYTPVPMGDTMDQAAERITVELAQVTLFQPWRGLDGKPAERYDVPDLVWRDLDGALLPAHPKKVSGCKVRSRVRLPRIDARGDSAAEDADGANVVQDTFTIAITRSV